MGRYEGGGGGGVGGAGFISMEVYVRVGYVW